jgi:hypothetical protein
MNSMKKLIIFWILFTALLGGGVIYAQKPMGQKPTPSGAAVQFAPREIRSEEKREELSRKLLHRKNELRREEHEHAIERRNTEVHEKPPK